MPVKPNLPLPKGYFGDAQITGDERSRIHNGVRVQLERALADQLAFVHADKRQVHSGTWRLVKKKRQLRIYRRRAHTGALTSNDDPETPSMLAVGRFEGSIEDVLYGGYDKSHEDLQTTMGIIGAWRRDGGGNTKLCARCGGTAGYFSSLKSCGVCGDAVCSQCHVKKAIFVGASHSLCRVPCCHKCIMEARNMKVRPAEPEYSILSGQYLPQEQYSMLENSDSPDDNSTPASASEEQEELAYSQRSQQPLGPNASGVPDLEDSTRELDVNQQRFSCDSGISEDDVEKILASMLAQRQQVKGEYGTDHTSGSRAGPGHSGLLLSNSSDGSGGASYSSLAVAAAAAVATTPASAAPSEMTPGQAAIYYKILALQSAANEAYWMAQANNEIMRGAP
ncbi:hypothetical protein PybrP1_002529 [[Pythium] brassicae (nom. inval.)]|nr:hypothetical protein PybrP1_002529 [[Pythium] brassicae (nom. inval.)]